MLPDGTTGTETPPAPAATQPPAVPPAAPATPPPPPAAQPPKYGQVEVPPFMSSKQMRQAGETVPGDPGSDGGAEFWRAKYDGLVGAAQERWRGMTGQIESAQMETRTRDDQIARLTTEVEGLRTQAATLVATQQALEQANTQIAQLQAQTARQAILMKHPKLLAATVTVKDAEGKETTTNPYLDLIMSATLTPDELDAKAAALVSSLASAPAGLLPGGAIPPRPPETTGVGTPEYHHQMAMQAHARFIASGKKEDQEEEQQQWELKRKALAAQK